MQPWPIPRNAPSRFGPPNVKSEESIHGTPLRSKTIPLPSSHIARTASELQLSEDLAAAEQRDINMFYRVVNGMRRRQEELVVASVSRGQDSFWAKKTPDASHTEPSTTSFSSSLPVSSDHYHEHFVTPLDTPPGTRPTRVLEEIPMMHQPHSVLSTHDDWSIGGYEGEVHEDEEDDSAVYDESEDEGVFSLDL